MFSALFVGPFSGCSLDRWSLKIDEAFYLRDLVLQKLVKITEYIV